jgi:hypothetical protein
VLNVLANILLWFLVSFISQGYGISKSFLSENSGTKRLAALSILLYVIAYVVMMLWYYLGKDDATTVFIFDEPMGVVNIDILCYLFLVFVS